MPLDLDSSVNPYKPTKLSVLVQDLLKSCTCFLFAEGLHLLQSQSEGYEEQKIFFKVHMASLWTELVFKLLEVFCFLDVVEGEVSEVL